MLTSKTYKKADQAVVADPPGKTMDASHLSFKPVLGVVFLSVFLSCGSVGTVKREIRDPAFQAENRPIRTIEVAVVADMERNMEEIFDLLNKASEALTAQVGIALSVRSVIVMEDWRASGTSEALSTMYCRTRDQDGRTYDMMIGFPRIPASEYIVKFLGLVMPTFTWEGVIDDVYRRYIVIKKLDPEILLHEIFHAFIFSKDHGKGVMAGTRVQVLPLLPAINRSQYLGKEERVEVLRNKWRDFRTSTAVDLARREDVIDASVENCETLIEKAVTDIKQTLSARLKPGQEITVTSAEKTKARSIDTNVVEWVEKSSRSAEAGEWAETIRAASVAISMDKGVVDAYINRAWALTEKGMPDLAIEDCNKALKIGSRNAVAYNNRGYAYQKKGEIAKAKSDYEKSCHLRFETGCSNLKAISEQIPAVVPAKISWLLDESHRAYQEGDWDGVVRLTTEALRLAADNEIAYANRAAAFNQMGQFEKAIEDCSAAIRHNPEFPLSYNNRGYALERLDRPTEAAVDYEISCRLGSDIGCRNYAMLSRTRIEKQKSSKVVIRPTGL